MTRVLIKKLVPEANVKLSCQALTARSLRDGELHAQ